MDIEILPDTSAVAARAAAFVAAKAREAIAERGRFVIAVSGGTTPWQMLRDLANEQVPWHGFHFVQVDERVASDNHPDRNLTHLRESLLTHAPLTEQQIHAMPVTDPDLNHAAARYGQILKSIAGAPPLLDLVHLGLGSDGHTASLVPGDAVLDVTAVDVAPTEVYQGRRRLTLTYPILNRARSILWLVTGSSKSEMLARLRDGDQRIPAGQISQSQATVLADRDAASLLRSSELTEH